MNALSVAVEVHSNFQTGWGMSESDVEGADGMKLLSNLELARMIEALLDEDPAANAVMVKAALEESAQRLRLAHEDGEAARYKGIVSLYAPDEALSAYGEIAEKVGEQLMSDVAEALGENESGDLECTTTSEGFKVCKRKVSAEPSSLPVDPATSKPSS